MLTFPLDGSTLRSVACDSGRLHCRPRRRLVPVRGRSVGVCAVTRALASPASGRHPRRGRAAAARSASASWSTLLGVSRHDRAPRPRRARPARPGRQGARRRHRRHRAQHRRAGLRGQVRCARRREKHAIAAAAAELVAPGQAVGISAGTTTWTLAYHLRDIPDLTVVTNSVPGRRRPAHQRPRPTARWCSPAASAPRPTPWSARSPSTALRSLHLDVVFLGVHGFDERAGFTTPNLMEAETNRALVEAGRQPRRRGGPARKWGVVGLSLHRARSRRSTSSSPTTTCPPTRPRCSPNGAARSWSPTAIPAPRARPAEREVTA